MPLEKKTYSIDAKGRTLGRVASEAAHILLGKNTVTFVKHQAAPVSVVVENASKLLIREPKKDQKEYIRYSGYPGGLKSATLREVIEKKGHAEVLRRAVKGMLPKNRLQSVRMKNLVINN
jgi:large subunit ribosomal protein L13